MTTLGGVLLRVCGGGVSTAMAYALHQEGGEGREQRGEGELQRVGQGWGDRVL